jgi:hypothetical protein
LDEGVVIDRTGQTWEYGEVVYLVVRAPILSGVGEVREQLWYHPSVLLDNGEDTLYGEHEHLPWEEDRGFVDALSLPLPYVHVTRKRIT